MPSDRDAARGADSVPARRRELLVSGHQGVGPAVASLADDDPTIRIAALGALARAGQLAADLLVGSLGDADARVRRRAAELAAACPDAGITAHLLGLLRDADTLVAEMAAWSLGERPVKDEVVRALAEMAVGHEDALCREAAVAALGALGDPAGLPAILSATSDKPAIRRRAVIALAPFDGPDVEAALIRARSDRDWQVRQAAEDQEGR